MKTTWMMMLTVLAVASMGAGGCDADDARLAEYAKNSVDQQTRQNEQIARQNQEVTQQNRQVAEGAHKLVEADARARQELVSAQQALQTGLQAERSTLDQQRQDLEQERKDIAHERYWQPLIAEAISGVGVLAACLAPLLLCFLVLRNVNTEQSDETALNELLVAELAAEAPRLLLAPADDRTELVGGPSPDRSDMPDDARLGIDPTSGI
jgi:ClpP class serine protease